MCHCQEVTESRGAATTGVNTSLLFRDKSLLKSDFGEFCYATHTQARHDASPMELHGFDRNMNHVSNFLVGLSLDNQLQDLALAVGQFIVVGANFTRSVQQLRTHIFTEAGSDVSLPTQRRLNGLVQFFACSRLKHVSGGPGF